MVFFGYPIGVRWDRGASNYFPDKQRFEKTKIYEKQKIYSRYIIK